MSVRGGLVAAVGAGLVLTLGGGAATAAPTVVPDVRMLVGGSGGVAPPEICNLYQSPSNARASICSAASAPLGGTVDGYFRGTLAGSPGWAEVRVNTTLISQTVTGPDFRGIWTDAGSVQFRVCGTTGGCGPWK